MRLVLALCLIALTPGVMGDAASGVNVLEPYARSAVQVQRNSAVFMRLQNSSKQKAVVVAASSPVAENVELHTHINDRGVMRMRRIPEIVVPPMQATELKPGGLHIMLLGLRQDLVIGQSIPVTLVFSDSSQQSLLAPVRKVVRPKGMSQHGQMQKH